MTKQAMLRVWFGLFVAVVFAAGAGTGLVLAPRLLPPAGGGVGAPPVVRGGFPRQPGMVGPMRLAPQLAEALGLDADQQQKLEEVFARRRGRLESIQRGVRRQFEDEQRALREEIRTILSDEQMALFEDWLRRSARRGLRRPPQRP